LAQSANRSRRTCGSPQPAGGQCKLSAGLSGSNPQPQPTNDAQRPNPAQNSREADPGLSQPKAARQRSDPVPSQAEGAFRPGNKTRAPARSMLPQASRRPADSAPPIRSRHLIPPAFASAKAIHIDRRQKPTNARTPQTPLHATRYPLHATRCLPPAFRCLPKNCQPPSPRTKVTPAHSKPLPRQIPPTKLARLKPPLDILIVGIKKQKRPRQIRRGLPVFTRRSCGQGPHKRHARAFSER
jgi:hypothetical protein